MHLHLGRRAGLGRHCVRWLVAVAAHLLPGTQVDAATAQPAHQMADIAAAAHLSAVDYVGGVPWDHNQEARTWYARVKSRPSFHSLLADHLPGLPPPAHYADLDF